MQNKKGNKPKKLAQELQEFISRLEKEINVNKVFKRECKVCHQMLEETKFFKGRNPFFMDGRINVCRNCISQLVDPHNPLEVQYVLSLMFLPYVEEVWESVLAKEENLLGTYVSKMNLLQYKNLEPAVVHRLKSQLDKFQQDPYQSRIDLMTEDELAYLRAEWGGNWTDKECLKMQDYYNEMKRDFNISNKAHDDYLKKIIKTSLTADKKLEEGEMGEYAKVSKIYNDLMKAAEFSEASKKDKRNDDGINAVGLIYALAEKKKFIPKYHYEDNPDIIDKTEKNLKSWMHKLIANEADLNILLENAAKRVVEQEKKEEQMSEYADIEQLEDGL
ncbi:MAG: hypothetical protein WCS33_00405 [Candidatus Caldatribacteriota bacterium]